MADFSYRRPGYHVAQTKWPTATSAESAQLVKADNSLRRGLADSRQYGGPRLADRLLPVGSTHLFKTIEAISRSRDCFAV